MSYSDVVLLDTPLVYYPLTEGGGTTAFDASGHGYNASANGSARPAYGIGLPGLPHTTAWQFGAFAVVGYLDSVVLASVLPEGNAPFSIECWVMQQGDTGTNGLVSWGTESSNAWTAFYVGGTQQISFLFDDGTNLRQDGVALPGVYHHLVATWDGVTRRLYEDGTLLAFDTPGVRAGVSGGDLLIGALHTTSQYFTGWIAHAAIYAATLPADRVAAHYSAGSVLHADPTTIHIVTTSIGLAAAATPVTITLVSTLPATFDYSGQVDLQRTTTTQTADDGTLDVQLDPNRNLNDVAARYRFVIGQNVYDGITIPVIGTSVDFLDLVPTRPDNTVAVTVSSADPSQSVILGASISAALSVDCLNLDGTLIQSGVPVMQLLNSSGDGTLKLDRTDQLIPVVGSGEPYYTIRVGGNIYYRKVHGAGAIFDATACPPALPSTSVGSIAAPETAIASGAPVPTHTTVPLTLLDDLQNQLFALAVQLQYGARGRQTFSPFRVYL